MAGNAPGTWWSRHYRAVIYGVLALVVLAPTFLNISLKLNISPSTKGVFDYIDAIPARRAAYILAVATNLAAVRAATPGDTAAIARVEQHLARLRRHTNGVLMLDFNFSPDVSAELEPMAEAVVRHAFERGVSILGTSYSLGSPMAKAILDRSAQEPRRRYAPKHNFAEYVFLGYRPGNVIMQMGQDIISAYGTEYGGKALQEIPFMQGVKNYNDIDYVLEITGFVGQPEYMITVINNKFQRPLGLGVTAVSAGDFYPYMQSRQITGLLVGLRGAAEYEIGLRQPAAAVKMMVTQLFTHLLAVALIVAGNIEFVWRKFHRA